jgi:pilus assembly protein CpaF
MGAVVGGVLSNDLAGEGFSLVEDEVRELVRRREVDPIEEPAVVRSLVEEVLNEYGTRALAGTLPALGDPSDVARHVYDAVAGFGPLQRYLDDPEVEELWINEPGRVFVARRGRSELTTTILDGQQVADLVERMLKHSGRRLDLSSPFVDAMLPDGSRLHCVIPDVTRRFWAVNVRKFVLAVTSLDELVRLGTMTGEAARFLEASVVAGLNIIVAGGTQAGKTTLLSCLAAAIPGRERVVSCEEVFELQPSQPDWVAMQTRQPSLEGTGEIRLRRLVKEALRMRPDRLLVGEVRQEEALDLLIALNSGLPGMCTLHANSAREAITKLCTLPLLAGENVAHSFVVPTVAASVDLVVHVAKNGAGVRRVTEIAALPGRIEGDVVEVAQIFHTVGGELSRASGFPPHLERYEQCGFEIADLLAGGDLPRTVM